MRGQPRAGPRLAAFFGCLYFAAMRPEEAVDACAGERHPAVRIRRVGWRDPADRIGNRRRGGGWGCNRLGGGGRYTAVTAGHAAFDLESNEVEAVVYGGTGR